MAPEIKAGSIVTDREFDAIRVFYVAQDAPDARGFFPCTHIICNKDSGRVTFFRAEAWQRTSPAMEVVGQSPFNGKNLCDLVREPADVQP